MKFMLICDVFFLSKMLFVNILDWDAIIIVINN